MARVFTTEFWYHTYLFKALIVITDEDSGLNVCIRVFDKESIRILGNDYIEFIGLQGYKTELRFQNTEAQELLAAVHKAILNHLNKQ